MSFVLFAPFALLLVLVCSFYRFLVLFISSVCCDALVLFVQCQGHCSCVKAGVFCQSCVPSRQNNCVNFPVDASPRSVPSDSVSDEDLTSSHLVPDLPPFYSVVSTAFSWGSVDGDTFAVELREAFREVTGWKKNCFKLPHGNSGYSIVCIKCFDLLALMKYLKQRIYLA